MTHEGKRVVVGRQQLEGMINSPDTSVHITAERQDRRREGGMEGVKKGHVVKEQIDKCERNTRRQQGGERRKKTGQEFCMNGGVVSGQGQRRMVCLGFLFQVTLICRGTAAKWSLLGQF